jgi:hypothetical protein
MSFLDLETSHSDGHRAVEDALQLGPRKKPYVSSSGINTEVLIMINYRRLSDPLVHYGRHFGRTVHALCSVKALITNGLLRIGERASEPDESFTWEYVF